MARGDDESEVLSQLPSRHVPFWKTASPPQRRALEAATFRREAEAGRFLADNDPTVEGDFGEIVTRRVDEQRRPFPGGAHPR